MVQNNLRSCRKESKQYEYKELLKKTFLLYFLFPVALSAQDLVYTISGELKAQKTSLNTILVENLSNNSRILFDNLPSNEYYQINLSRNASWGTVGIESASVANVFIETKNEPSLIKFSYNGNTPAETQFSIFNINGRLVFQNEKTKMLPSNSVRIHLGVSGVFLVRITTAIGMATFRGIGSETQSGYSVHTTDEVNLPGLKSNTCRRSGRGLLQRNRVLLNVFGKKSSATQMYARVNIAKHKNVL